MKGTINHFFAPSAKGLVGAMGRAALVLLCVLSAAGAWAQNASGNFTVSGDTYTIQNAAGWDEFCNAVTNGDNFSGKTIVLAQDITVTSMAGSTEFRGTFNGNGHTLTLHYGSPEARVDAQFVAPFPSVSGGATFSNLHVNGYIYSTYTTTETKPEPGVGGLIGHIFGNITIEHCTSSVKITSTTGTLGGFVGLCDHAVKFTDCVSSAVIHSNVGSSSGFVGWSRASGYTISFEGCLFNGKVLNDGNSSGNGGFVGWKGFVKTVNITDCLYAPAPLEAGEDYASSASATFCRYGGTEDNGETHITNCYYTQAFGAVQGNQARAISGGEHVTLANAGTPVVTYTTSGITSYGTGIEYNNVFYAGVDDEVSLTLSSDQPAEGYSFSGYNATPGGATLTASDANRWTLTMPDADVTIGAVYTPVTYSITYELGGGALPEGRANPESYTVESEAFTLVNPERDGYVFAGWTGGGLSEPTKEVTIAKGSTTGDKTFTATWQMPPIAYIDADGTTKTCSEYTVLNGGSSTRLAAGWYVVSHDITYTSTVNIRGGDTHLILMDGAVMRIGTEQSPVDFGIDASNSSLCIYACSTGDSKGQLHINASLIGIYFDGGNLTVNGGKVTATATSRYGILASGGNVTVNGGEVVSTTSSESFPGIYAQKSSGNGGSITLANAAVTAAGGYAIRAEGGITINSGTVKADSSSYGIYAEDSDITINGGQVEATSTSSYGIAANNITLSWTAPTDFISANSYRAYNGGTITLAKDFADGDGNIIHSGTVSASAIKGQKLLPANAPLNLTATNITVTSATLTWQPSGEETQWLVSWSTDDGSTWSTPVTVNECSYELTGLSGGTTVRVKVQAIFGEGLYSVPATCTFSTALTPVNYLDADGTTQTCLNYTVLTGSESELAEGWYVAEGNVSFDHQLSASDGDIHLILKDGAVMRIGTEESPVSDYGIYANGHSISIHGQSTGEQRGQLWINATDYGIYAQGGNVEISGGEVHTKSSGDYSYGINIKGGSLSMTNAVIIAEGKYLGISANGGLTAQGCTITAKGSSYGIFSAEGDITLTDCKVTATGSSFGINSPKGDITLTDCKVTATGEDGIFAGDGNVDISGGQVTATGTDGNGIYSTGSITLSWNAPTDFIESNSYYASGTITLAKAFADGDGNIYSGTVSASAINGKKLLPANGPLNLTATDITETSAMLTWDAAGEETQWLVSWSTNGGSTWITSNAVNNNPRYELTGLSANTTVRVKVQAILGDGLYSAPATCTFGTPLTYFDINGTTQTCSNYTVLTGSEETLAAGWYVADGTVSFDHMLSASDGDIHLILKDGAMMRIGTEESPVGTGIYANGYTISIHGQSTGEQRGQLWINATYDGIAAYGGNVEISGGTVEAKGTKNCGIFATQSNNNGGSISMTGATVTAEGFAYGIYTSGGHLTAEGCAINATSINDYGYGIYSSDGNITLTDCEVTATGSDMGIFAQGGNVEISGGQVTATGTNSYGINTTGSITLSWNAPTDFIEASSYYARGTITLTKAFTDGDGNIINSGTVSASAIDGKKLLPHNGPFNLTATNITETSATLTWEAAGEETQWLVSWSTDGGSTWSTPDAVNECSYELTGLSVNTIVRVKVQAILDEGLYSAPATCTFGTPLTYLDINGTTQTCSNYTVLTGSEETLAAGWYVADGTVSFNHTLSTSGDIHLILKDGAVMRIGTEESPVSDYGIYAYGHSISIHGQSTGNSRGQLWINAQASGIYAQGGNVEISGGQVETKGTNAHGIYATQSNNSGGSISMTRATVTAEGFGNGISGGHLTAEGCTITATGTQADGIYSTNGNITLTDCEVTATGSAYGISAQGGNVEISGGEVEAKGNNGYGINAMSVSMTNANITAEGEAHGIWANGGHLTAEGCTITATGTQAYGIYSTNGNITLTDCEVTAKGMAIGIYADGGNVEISGGQVTATGTGYKGIYATGSITLSWNAPTDFIEASSYEASGTITLAKAFTDGDGNIYSGVIDKEEDGTYAINGKKLLPYITTNSAGDANGDDVVTIADVVMVVSYLVNGVEPEGFNFDQADVDGSGTVDTTDLRAIVDMILEE